jgi:hypothetical protein
LLKVLNGPANLNPVMLRLLKNGYDGCRIVWVCHRADGNADHRGQIGDFPVDGRAALRTKIVMNVPAAGRSVRKFFCVARDADDIGGVVGTDTERRAGPPLAVDAVTGNDDPGWLFRERQLHGTATASGIAHRKSPQRFPSLRSLAPQNAGGNSENVRRQTPGARPHCRDGGLRRTRPTRAS